MSGKVPQWMKDEMCSQVERARRERDEAQAMVEAFRLIYAKAVGRDDVTDLEASLHLGNVIANERANTKVAERERNEALGREAKLRDAAQAALAAYDEQPEATFDPCDGTYTDPPLEPLDSRMEALRAALAAGEEDEG